MGDKDLILNSNIIGSQTINSSHIIDYVGNNLQGNNDMFIEDTVNGVNDMEVLKEVQGNNDVFIVGPVVGVNDVFINNSVVAYNDILVPAATLTEPTISIGTAGANPEYDSGGTHVPNMLFGFNSSNF